MVQSYQHWMPVLQNLDALTLESAINKTKSLPTIPPNVSVPAAGVILPHTTTTATFQSHTTTTATFQSHTTTTTTFQ
jgi:hypothetical protein